jgi:putative membrane protein
MKSLRFLLLASTASLLFALNAGAYGQERKDRALPETPEAAKPVAKDERATKSRPSRGVSARDKQFMEDAAHAGYAEVEMGKLAVSKATSDAVKQFAQHMIDDHTKANDELKQIAEQKRIKLPSALDAAHRRVMTDLKAASGESFDRRYIAEAGIKDHQKAQKLFESAEKNANDADVKAYAAKTLPDINKHLEMARDIGGIGASRKSNR